MQQMDNNKLKDALEIMLKKMQKLGMLPPVNDFNKLLNNVIDKVGKHITAEKLKTPEVKKGLMFCLLAEATNEKQPQLAINLEKFFENKNDQPEPLLKKELKDELSKLFKKLYELTPGAKKPNDEELEKKLDKFIEHVFDKSKKSEQDSLIENNYVLNLLLDAYTEALHSINVLSKDKEFANLNIDSQEDQEKIDSNALSPQVIVDNLTIVADQSNQSNEIPDAIVDKSSSYRSVNGAKHIVRTHLETIADAIDNELTENGVYAPPPPRPSVPGASPRKY